MQGKFNINSRAGHASFFPRHRAAKGPVVLPDYRQDYLIIIWHDNPFLMTQWRRKNDAFAQLKDFFFSYKQGMILIFYCLICIKMYQIICNWCKNQTKRMLEIFIIIKAVIIWKMSFFERMMKINQPNSKNSLKEI